MLRSLTYYWRTHLAVAGGAAVATAVLTGALLVGDSVRGSLRDLTLDRLGGIEAALVGERLFREELAADLEGEAPEAAAATVLILRGSAVAPASGARASGVTLYGVDGRLPALYGDGAPQLDFTRRAGGIFPPAWINEALAGELGVEAGDELLVSFERRGDVSRETLVGRSEGAAAVETLRLTLAGTLPDRGLGGFTLALEQTRPFNAFVDLGRLQRALGQPGRVNALLAGGARQAGRTAAAPAVPALDAALRSSLTAEDLGLLLEAAAGGVRVESREFVLRPELAAAVLAEAEELGAPAQQVLTYLANSIAAGSATVPYSTVSALDPPPVPALGPFRLTDGSPAPALKPGEILLNAWAAEDLGARPGDEITLTYYRVGLRDELSTAEARFRLRGVVAMEGLGADPGLTPDFPGMAEAEDIAAWDPPFPVDLDRIRPRDEAYWDEHRAAPKAFVSPADGERLWRTRFGAVTSVRLAPPEGMGAEELALRLGRGVARRAGVELALRPIKQEGLDAAQGATDFAGLFVGFSFFLIVSSALLVGLLFRLGVEQRAREVGLLLAVGYPGRAVRRRFLAEGGLLAAVGAAAGLAGAAGYAWLMLAGLRTWWLPAVGTPVLFLHVAPVSLGLGWLLSVLVVLVSVWWAVRRLHRTPAPALLAGAGAQANGPGRRRWARWVALGAAVVALGLLVATFAGGREASPALAFGTGACLLVAGLAAFARRGSGPVRERANALTGAPVLSMGARNSARNPGRSLLSAALVACACFVIVAVAANRLTVDEAVSDRSSGAGGFTLVAESDVPIVADLGDPERRSELGLSPEVLAGVEVMPLRLLPGDEASCLNLFRPRTPRVLGVPPEMIRRGGFTFRATARPTEHPWSLLTEDLGPGVVPAFGDANSVQWILHKGLGDELVYRDDGGSEVRLRLVGLLADSLFQSELLISEEAFVRHFPEHTGYRVFLLDAPPQRAGEIAAGLESDLARFGFDATGTAERLASYHAVQNTYLSTFQTLGGLGLLLGTLGLGIVLLRNVLERRGEMATLRAMGFRRRTLSAMVVAENAYLLLVGIVVGSGSALVAVAPNLLAGGGGVPWISLALTLALVFLVGLAASLAAVAGALRTPLLPALRAE